MIFSNKVKWLREQNNMSTRLMAEELGVSQSMVSKYENGIHEPTLSVLRKYAEIFNVTLDYLCDDNQ